MSIAVVCESCERSLKVGDDLAGRKIKCPGCGKVLAVPDEEADEPRARKRARSREEEEDEERPRRKGGKKRSKKGLIIGLSIGGGVLAVGLVILLLVLLGGARDNPNATEENFDKIKRGTSQEEVEKILGKGDKVSHDTLSKALHTPPSGDPPVKGGRIGAQYYRWKNKTETIFLLIALPGEGPAKGVMAGWFVREQKRGKPKYKLLGFGKLE